jgi:sugar/nucleoside kinase (ribokinase family)
MDDKVDVMCIGHIDKGRIVVEGDRMDTTGGAIYYGGVVLRKLGLKIAVLTRLAEKDSGLLGELKAAGADIYPILTEETTGVENIIPDRNSDKRACYSLGFAGTFSVEDIPPVDARLYYVGSIVPNEVDFPFLREIASRGPLAVDAQGFIRKEVNNELISEGWGQARDMLPLIHYLKVDNHEASVVTGEKDRYKAAKMLRDWGAREIVLTHQDGVMLQTGDEEVEKPFRPRSLAGRTGRGDSCFSAYLGRRLLGDPPEMATKFAAALTTLKLERPGPFRSSVEEVRRVMRTN